MIYAIGTVGLGYIKFGISNTPSRRLDDLQTACPLDLEILATAHWPDHLERAIHKYLECHAIRGEWFEDSYRTQDVIQMLLEPEGQARFESLFKTYQALVFKEARIGHLSKADRRLKERKAWWNKQDAQPILT